MPWALAAPQIERHAHVNVTQTSWSVHMLWSHRRSWFKDTSFGWEVGDQVEIRALDGLVIDDHPDA